MGILACGVHFTGKMPVLLSTSRPVTFFELSCFRPFVISWGTFYLMADGAPVASDRAKRFWTGRCLQGVEERCRGHLGVCTAAKPRAAGLISTDRQTAEGGCPTRYRLTAEGDCPTRYRLTAEGDCPTYIPQIWCLAPFFSSKQNIQDHERSKVRKHERAVENVCFEFSTFRTFEISW